MAKDNAQSSFQRGVMSLLILSLLDQEDMYGYQIVQEIDRRWQRRDHCDAGGLFVPGAL